LIHRLNFTVESEAASACSVASVSMEAGMDENVPLVKREVGATVLAAGGLTAAFAAATCCAIPFTLASWGLGAAWLGGIAILADPYKEFLIGFAAIALLVAFGLFVRHRIVIACTPGAACARPGFRAITPVLLIAGGTLAWLAFRIG
jgi:mercuric ion transport protein